MLGLVVQGEGQLKELKHGARIGRGVMADGAECMKSWPKPDQKREGGRFAADIETLLQPFGKMGLKGALGSDRVLPRWLRLASCLA